MMSLNLEIVQVINGYVVYEGNRFQREDRFTPIGQQWVARDIPELKELIGQLAEDVKPKAAGPETKK